MDKITSTGGPTEYYDFPEGANTLNDLIELKNMSFAQGNIFKAAFRLGAKADVSEAYDLRKIIYYALRMLRVHNSGIASIMEQINGWGNSTVATPASRWPLSEEGRD